MKDRIIYLLLCVVLFSSCEEYYKPDLEVASPILVVESRMTNNPTNNFVKLTTTRDFYNTTETTEVTGAKVELIQVGGQTERGNESGTGYFTFQSTLISGKKYFIRITTSPKDIYESETVTMPPLPKIDSLYTDHKIVKTYLTDAFGVPTLVEAHEREVYIDAPLSSALEYYRFNYRGIIQWVYDFPPNPFGPSPPSIYGWKSIYNNGLFNIAGPKEFSSSDKITRHPVLSLKYDSRLYLDSLTQSPMGWIIILDEYGITKSSYDFHEKLNKQFSAEGSLFDPVLTQVYGNIHCKSDQSKIALGFFDLNSYRQYRYFLNFFPGAYDYAIQRRLNRHLNIPETGWIQGERPIFWESN